MNDALMQNYARLPVAFTRGEGAWLWDEHGRRYLDALSGIAVCGLGHAHPAITQALCEQAGTLLHTSNLYRIPLQEQLAERLCALADMQRVFFCNSGAEANEAAIKLARLHAHRRGIERPRILVTEGSFHGRTLGALSATGNSALQAGFGPLLDGFPRVPHGDIEALREAGADNPDVVAVLVEPITGEGGIRVPPPGYLEALRALCDEHGWLMMLDEVQSGVGRTGRWFAHQHEAARPDVLTLAKGLGNGVPIGALLARGAAAEVFSPGTHGTTFGGGPLVSRVALTVLATIEHEALTENATARGAQILDGLRQGLGKHPGVREIRGRGLMIGLELEQPCKPLVQVALERGLLINVTAERVVRLLPPLVIDASQAQAIVDRVVELVRDFLTQAA